MRAHGENAMPLIQKRDADQLRALLRERLEESVTIDLFTRPESRLVVPGRECEACDDTRALLEEVAHLSDRIHLNVHDFFVDDGAEASLAGADRIPAIVLAGRARGSVRYFGIPAGYEFGSFVEGLVEVGNGSTDLLPETRTALDSLIRPVRIRVFVTPSCPFCPAAARLAQKMAVESDKVTAEIVEASEFPDLVERYGVQGVPKTVVNELVEFVGAQPEARLLEHVLRAAA
jgi:glutaredoxin-like protein